MKSINFWTDQRIKRILISCVLAVFLSSLFVYFNDGESTSALKRGDFPAFYAVARIVAEGESINLYDQSLQRKIENDFWPSLKGSYYSFAYPPFSAAFLSPLAYFSPQVAKQLFFLFSLVLLAMSIKMATSFVPLFKQSQINSFLCVLLFPPLLHGSLSGQNIAISIFLYTGVIFFLKRETKLTDLMAGVFLGLWFYKPHFPLLILFVLAFKRKWFVVVGSSAVLLLNFLIGVYLVGWDWIFKWLNAVRIFADLDSKYNGHQMISISSVIDGGFWVNLAILFFGIIVFLFFTRKDNSLNIVDSVCMLGAIAVLVSPHALYYDLGLVVIPFVRFLHISSDREVSLIFALNLFMYLLVLTRDQFPISPFIGILVAFTLFMFQSHRCNSIAN